MEEIDEIQKYFSEKKKFYNKLMKFLENSEPNDNDFNQIIEIIKDTKCTESHEEFTLFLCILINLSNNHHRQANFINNIEKIIQYLLDQIKQTFSNYEIFNIFQSNKLILQFLLEERIMTIDEQIYQEIYKQIELNGNQYFHFFIPEMKEFKGEENFRDIENEIILQYPNIYDNYDTKRKTGENDSYICSLIRQDLIEDFIAYVNKRNISLTSQINPSIFETNAFLIENMPTLIEYAFYFGSIQIINYLILNKVKLTSSLWIYAIHSNNAEVIYILETNKIKPLNYERFLIESIKCHHNEIANYFLTNFLKEDKIFKKNNFIKAIFQYNNYSFFNIDINNNNNKFNFFFYSCNYNYSKIVNLFLLIKEKSDTNKSQNILNQTIFFI